jgi:hypothetical protein
MLVLNIGDTLVYDHQCDDDEVVFRLTRGTR